LPGAFQVLKSISRKLWRILTAPFVATKRRICDIASSIPFFGGKTEKAFRTAFCMVPESRRNDLIAYYQRKHKCTRKNAMQRAIEDRARDNGYRI